MIVESPDALLRRLEQGHWFLKHRAKGDKPHKRFVYCDGPAIYWANREDRTGKVGCLKAVGELLVVPGLASAVLFGKARLRDRQNRLFSLVSSERSLDLEVGTEAERHLWVKVFNAFAQRHSPERASRSSQRETGEPSSSGASPPHTPTSGAPTLRDDGAALQAQLYMATCWIACGCSLGCMRLQPALHMVAAWAYGLQPELHAATAWVVSGCRRSCAAWTRRRSCTAYASPSCAARCTCARATCRAAGPCGGSSSPMASWWRRGMGCCRCATRRRWR